MSAVHDYLIGGGNKLRVIPRLVSNGIEKEFGEFEVELSINYTNIKYGYLYNWYAATDSRKISSSDDWVVPTKAKYETLVLYLGGVLTSTNIYDIAGGKLKEAGTIYWNFPNTGATNESGFNGRGGGERWVNGSFDYLKTDGYQWSSDSISFPSLFMLFNTSDIVEFLERQKILGESLRLVYEGVEAPTSYIGNDGKVYRTVMIGSQIWLADNLSETKYRNNDWITGFDGGVYTPISNANWATLTTGALCAYNDDESNVLI